MSPDSGKMFTFSWKIINFSSCSLKNGQRLESPVISVEGYENTKWLLRLFPKGLAATDYFTSCFLRIIALDDCKKSFALSSFTLEIIDPNGKSVTSKERKDVVFNRNEGYGFFDFIKINRLAKCMENWKEDTLEIRCHVFRTSYKQPPILYKALTEIQVQKYMFDWDIDIPTFKNWSKTIECRHEAISFDINLTADDDIIFIKIYGLGKEQRLTKVCKVKCSILNKKGINISLKNAVYSFELPEFETSLEKQQLDNKFSLASINSFKLICAINISNWTPTSTFVTRSYENTLDHENSFVGEEHQQLSVTHRTLQEDLKDMFLNRKHCDVILQADNDTFPVHKGLLSTRSPVFSAMFDQDMVESQTGIVDIPDVESDTLGSFLEFLYTDTISNTDCEDLLKIMLVADKYQVNILKEKCSELIMPKLSRENVCEVIAVADMVNHSNLKLFALGYIKTNKKDFLSSPDWTEWVKKNMVLGIEILTELSTG